ncbi:metallophosphoesterase [Shouchella sp. 1P09AA]|uniref:metallophosphoesterase n=1 Tax=unclassified Shouchella TaxID=2893065 RepID=UPI00399F5328
MKYILKKKTWSLFITMFAVLMFFQSSHPVDAKNDKSFSFVWMSDTQYYSQKYPYIYDHMTSWIAEHAKEESIKYVIHTGDIVDRMNNEFEWVQADVAMKKLDEANIPYGVLAGNHDIGHNDRNYKMFKTYFGDERFKNTKAFKDSYKDNEAHYDTIVVNRHKLLILYLGFGWDQETLNWAEDVLSDHSDHTVILATHRYLQVDGQRSKDGNLLFEKLVVPHENVQLVLSGHYHGHAQRFDRLDQDGDGINERIVVQLLSDYQSYEKGGNGFMRILTFHPNTSTVEIRTYSPYTNEHLLEDEEFQKIPMSFHFPLTF